MQNPLRLLGIAAASGSLILTGCGSSSEDGGGGSSSGSSDIAAVIKGLDNPFFQAMESGIKDQAKEDSVKVTVQAAQAITDTTGQSD